jgi:hypothetical protein
MSMLGKDDILRGLRKIDTLAKEAGVIIDLAVYGGAALALIFDARVQHAMWMLWSTVPLIFCVRQLPR